MDKVVEKTTEDDENKRLFYGIDDVPPWPTAILFGLQQVMVCISAVFAVPILISDLVCASAVPLVRVKLIGSSFVITGISTLVQTIFGTRLPLLQGPSFAFLPPIFTFMDLPEFQCPPANSTHPLDDSVWMERITTIQGSLIAASAIQMLIGLTGLIGFLTRYVGPLTIAPLMLLLEASAMRVCLRYSEKHWISVVLILAILLTALYLNGLRIPMPKWGPDGLTLERQPVFALFPYLIAITVIWAACAFCTLLDIFPEGSAARTDTRASVLRDAPWIRVPYPGQWGAWRFNTGIFFGFVAATLASVIESIGDYHACARVAQLPPPPAHAVSRGIFCEGIGCLVGGFVGDGVSQTTYSENVGLIGMTRVASRATLNIAGVFFIVVGVSTKIGALLSTIPDPLVGGILTVSLAMVGGVGLASVQLIDLKLARNVAVLGISIMLGLMIPAYIRTNPIQTGLANLDQLLNILLQIEMFMGGAIGFILDNSVPGATKRQRGLKDYSSSAEVSETEKEALRVYDFSPRVMELLAKVRCLRYVPCLPPTKATDRVAAATDLEGNMHEMRM